LQTIGVFEQVENAIKADARPIEGREVQSSSHSYILQGATYLRGAPKSTALPGGFGGPIAAAANDLEIRKIVFKRSGKKI
jgi:hypothetical protein